MAPAAQPAFGDGASAARAELFLQAVGNTSKAAFQAAFRQYIRSSAEKTGCTACLAENVDSRNALAGEGASCAAL